MAYELAVAELAGSVAGGDLLRGECEAAGVFVRCADGECGEWVSLECVFVGCVGVDMYWDYLSVVGIRGVDL